MGLISNVKDCFKNESLTVSEKIKIVENNNDIDSLICLLSPECDKNELNKKYGPCFYSTSIETDDWHIHAAEALGRIGNARALPSLFSVKFGAASEARKAIKKIKSSSEYKKEIKEKRKVVYQIEKKLLKNRTQIEKQILTKGDNILIDNFAKTYSNNYTVDEFHKLKDLMELKGYKINDNTLKLLIVESAENYEYLSFKEKVLYNSPENIDQYIFNYVEIYGENYEDKLEYLKALIKEQGFNISKTDLNREINDVIKKKELLNFKKSLLDNGELVLSINEIDKLTGYEFEAFTKILFEKMGYKTHRTKYSGDQGADLILKKFGEVTVVQAKRHANKITNKAIQEVVASLKYYNADEGIVITNNLFTDSAVKLANSNDIKLVNRPKLSELMHRYPINKTNLKKITGL